jgi:hypothetical protein
MYGQKNKPAIGDFPSHADKSGENPCIDPPQIKDKDEIQLVAPPKDDQIVCDVDMLMGIFNADTGCH